jgi:tetratricopeptide (TPR) repeat protein
MPDKKRQNSDFKKQNCWSKLMTLAKKQSGKKSRSQSVKQDETAQRQSQEKKNAIANDRRLESRKRSSKTNSAQQYSHWIKPEVQENKQRGKASYQSSAQKASKSSAKAYTQRTRPRTLGNKQLDETITPPAIEKEKIIENPISSQMMRASEEYIIPETHTEDQIMDPIIPIVAEAVVGEVTEVVEEEVAEAVEEEVAEAVEEEVAEAVEEEVAEAVEEEVTEAVEEEVAEAVVEEVTEAVMEEVAEPVGAMDVHEEVDSRGVEGKDTIPVPIDTLAEKLEQEEVILEQKEIPQPELFTEAVSLYRLGIAGDKKAVAQAYELLKKVHESDPDNRLVEAYLGSATSLLGRDAADPNERFKLVLQGLKVLDKLVSLEPENTEIRTLRAFQCSKLPEMYFHRTDTAIEDFSYLVSRFEENNSLFPTEFYYQILIELGSAYNRLDRKKEAQAIFKKLLSKTDDPKYQALVEQEGVVDSSPEKPKWQKQLEKRPVIKNDWAKAKDDEKLQNAISLHSKALASDTQDAEKALEFFEKAHKRRPEDPLIKAYYADCLSLVGQKATDTSKMFRNAIQSMRNFDQAVNASPDNISIRLLRGNNSYRLPEAFFRRTLTAICDFEYIVQKVEQDPSILPQETYWQILHDLGDAYQRLDMEEDAQAIWNKLAQSGDPQYQTIAEEMINQAYVTDSLDLGPNPSSDELLQEGIRLYDLAVAGNKKAGLKAEELLQKAYQTAPSNALAQAYYGSIMVVNGRNSMDPQLMFSSYFKGLDNVKKAIARNSKDVRLNLLLAYLTYNYAPNFVASTDQAIKQFKYLKMAYEKDNSLFDEEQYLKILYDLGVCYQRAGQTEQAQKVWQRLLKKTSDSKYQQLLGAEEEGDMDKDRESAKEKYKAMAMEIAKEKARERSEDRDKERSKDKKRSKERSKERTKHKETAKVSIPGKVRSKGRSKRKERSRDKDK